MRYQSKLTKYLLDYKIKGEPQKVFLWLPKRIDNRIVFFEFVHRTPEWVNWSSMRVGWNYTLLPESL